MTGIGGFFELELAKENEYYPNLIRLNTGRNALEYILRTRRYKKIHLPYYSCDSILEPVQRLSLKVEYYHIDEHFHPLIQKAIPADEVLLYINYFGINDEVVNKLVRQHKNIIIDNSQAFFSKPHPRVDTFYSARKFFGVPDGAYLSTDKLLPHDLPKDESYQRCEHLLKRLDTAPQETYRMFLENEKKLNNQPIKRMSKLTQSLLTSLSYNQIKKIRIMNFLYLHSHLKQYNRLEIPVNELSAPMIYPFFIEEIELMAYLVRHNIYVATYWKEVKNRVRENSFESKLTDHLIPLPVDQRYNKKHMEEIVAIIKKKLS